LASFPLSIFVVELFDVDSDAVKARSSSFVDKRSHKECRHEAYHDGARFGVDRRSRRGWLGRGGDVSLVQYAGGTFNAGRFSESSVDPGRDGQIGNTVNAESWNGSVLGTEWRLWCPSIQTPPVLVSDTRDGSNTGDVTYRTTYWGGYFWLSMTGPWGGSGEEYSGDLDFFVVTTTYMFVGGDLLGIRSHAVSYGQIGGYTDRMEHEINNAAFFGNTDDDGPKLS
jgi:hypothetical protein